MKITGQRIRKVLLVAAAIPMLVLCFVALSVWTEKRFPIEVADPAALTTRVRHALTQPVVRGLGRQIQRHVRQSLEGRWLTTQISQEETIARFLSPSTPRGELRMLAYRLARFDTPEAVAALVKGFASASPERRAFLAEILGMTGLAEMKGLLLPLLDEPDGKIAAAAVRGLGALGGADVTASLDGILADTGRTESLRGESARALASIGTTAARDALIRTLASNPANGLTPELLQSLGRFPFPSVARTFEDYLNQQDVPSELRIVAIEALAFSSKEAAPVLLRSAQGAVDAEERASAAWALSAHPGDFGATLAALTTQEPEPDVRRRLYEALLAQAQIPAEVLLPVVSDESDVAARVAGLNAIGAAVGRNPAGSIAQMFDARSVPDLQGVAWNENTLNVRLRAVFALRRAGTPAAQTALAALSSSSCPQVAAAARHGLRTPRETPN